MGGLQAGPQLALSLGGAEVERERQVTVVGGQVWLGPVGGGRAGVRRPGGGRADFVG